MFVLESPLNIWEDFFYILFANMILITYLCLIIKKQNEKSKSIYIKAKVR